MPRSCKCRRVCSIPENRAFFPQQPCGKTTALTVEELESVRLCDLENLGQDEAAENMNVSRPTFQRILYRARHKIAEALCAGEEIRIGGGCYEVARAPCGCRGRCRCCCFEAGTHHRETKPSSPTNRRTNQEENNMKIAVTTEGTQIFQHFGKCPSFTVFTVEGGTVRQKSTLDTSRNGHAALAAFLKGNGVDTVICGGIGAGAREMLTKSGISLVSGIDGNIDSAVEAYLAGNLTDQGGSCSNGGTEHNCDCSNHCH